ncbi:hypothetical protein [Salinimicrobium catena]|uniref:hypothetical protein n=1 Tax=Salinimicrobium catena TaxID=390640 RepID=UPI002FE46BA1
MITHYQNTNRQVQDPNNCPHGHVTNTPHNRWQMVSKDTDNTPMVLSAWTCANNQCNKLFICQHNWINGQFSFVRFLNGLPKGPDWPTPILELKDGKSMNTENPVPSKCIRTYLQSLEAEHHGLDELAGMGYRKAIEYLVKDWAIKNNPDKGKNY